VVSGASRNDAGKQRGLQPPNVLSLRLNSYKLFKEEYGCTPKVFRSISAQQSVPALAFPAKSAADSPRRLSSTPDIANRNFYSFIEVSLV
jgi:hypothetical protein